MTAIIEDNFAEFERAMAVASKEAVQEVIKLVKKDARKTVARAAVHRVERTYPGGRKYEDPLPLHRAVKSRIRTHTRKGQVRAKVFFGPGYSNFPTTGAWDTLKAALGANIDRAIPILTGKAPK